jgi:hypothetical protein
VVSFTGSLEQALTQIDQNRQNYLANAPSGTIPTIDTLKITASCRF